MRNVTLSVLGFVGLSLLLCGSGEVLAQTDTTDSRVQGTTPGDVRVGSSGTASPGTQTAASGADASSVELRQTVLQLQSEVAQLRQDLARVRSELASVAASSRSASGTGVGGSGQAGVAPSAADSSAPAIQDPSGGGTAAQGSVAGGTAGSGTVPRGNSSRAGMSPQSAQGADTANSGDAVVDAIYTGTVRSASAKQLVLLDEAGQAFTVDLSNQTRVLRNGQRIAAQDLKKGTRVRATVDMLSGRNQATEVRTLPAK